jgi:hypothetical protein
MWYHTFCRLGQDIHRYARAQVLELELFKPDGFGYQVGFICAMVEDLPVGIDVRARHGRNLLVDAWAGQSVRQLQQAQNRERD